MYPPLHTVPDDRMLCSGGAPMASVRVERLDHVGVMADVMND